jgi:hypothetical protein
MRLNNIDIIRNAAIVKKVKNNLIKILEII